MLDEELVGKGVESQYLALGDLSQQPHEQQRGAEKDDDQRVLPEKAQGAARDLAGPLGKLLAAGHV